MRRGTKVGQAYIAITADGSGINREIADQFDDVDFKKHGEKHGEEYRDALHDRLRGIEHDLRDVFPKRGVVENWITQAFDNEDAISTGVRQRVAKAFDDGHFESLIDRVGRRMGVRLGSEAGRHMRGGLLDALQDAVTDMAEKGHLDLDRLFRWSSDGIILPGPDLQKIEKAAEKAVKEHEKTQRAHNKFLLAEEKKASDQRIKVAAREAAERAKKIREQQGLWTRLLDERERQEEAYTKYLREEEERRTQDAARLSRARIKQEAQEARRRAKIRADYERSLTALLDRRAEDERFRRSVAAADRIVENFQKKRGRFAVQLDEKSLTTARRRIRDLVMEIGALRAKINTGVDLSEGEIARTKERIEAIRAKIPVELDHVARRGRDGERDVSGNRVLGVGWRRGGGRLGDIFGSMLGAGARNNALNLMGRSIGVVLNSGARLIQMGKSVGETFMKGFTQAGEGANFFQKSLSGVQAVGSQVMVNLAMMARAAPAVLASITVVILVMSAMVSVASALTAILVALTSTIVSGLVGAVTVLGGVLATAAAAGGLLVAAFLSMTDAQKKALKEAFGPVMDTLRGLGQLVLKDLVPAFKVWGTNLQRAVALVAPVAEVMGKAFATAGKELTAALSGPGFKLFAEMMTRHLPAITVNLTRALGNFLNGFMGIFAALTPMVRRFSVYLSEIATRFANWATSAEGQNAITDFVNRAIESLKSLWNFTREFFGFLGDLLFSPDAQNAGNSMFDSLARSFRGFRDAVKEASRNGDLKKWLDEAREFAGDLKQAIIGLKNAFQALDNSGVLDAVGQGLRLIGWGFSNIKVGAGFVFTALNPIVGLLLMLWDGITRFGNEWNAVWRLIQRVTGDIVGALIQGIQRLTNYVLGMISGLLTALKNTLGRFPNPARDAVNEMYDSFQGFATNTNDLFAKMANSAYGWGEGISSNIQAGVGSGVTVPVSIQVFEQNAASRGYQNRGLKVPKATRRLDKARGVGDYTEERVAARKQAKAQAKADAELKKLMDRLSKSGRDAANATTPSSGGGGTPNVPDEYDLPKRYERMAKRARKNAPRVAAQIKNAALSMNKAAGKAMRDAAKASDAAGVKDIMQGQIDSMKTSAKQSVNTAQDAVNSAAERLLNSSSKAETKRAVAALKRAKADRRLAREQRRNVRQVEKILAQQAKVTNSGVTKVARALDGLNVATATGADVAKMRRNLNTQNATLADFAKAREAVAAKIEEAQARLDEAIRLRDDYQRQIADGIKAFGSLLTAQAKTIDGVEQALTAADIVENLQDRLDQIRAFRSNLNRLLAMGLSQAAYKQLLDAGVEAGGAYVEAMVAGGAGAISDLNTLVAKIDAEADGLGTQAANRLYQAGVDAAQGLVDGLEALSSDLDRAAKRLGESIAKQIAETLGIKSPSRVAIGLMEDFGDGAVIGLRAQEERVGLAAERVAARVAVSPEVAAYAAQQRQQVSGNAPENGAVFRDLIVNTPTENPEAVAHEVLNEVAARL